MARAGLIPRDLATVDPPTCPGCAYGKAHKKPWRSKGIRNRKSIRKATAPGDVVSVDQLVSPTPGFVPTHRGRPTVKRYTAATIFVDHYSDFTYVHLMTTNNAETTVAAKQAFEHVAASHGVCIRHYHADNGLFDTKAFRQSIHRAHQTLSFCGVNAHHQNGKAENCVRDLTQGTRTSLLHAAHCWPTAIDASLWPSALKHYTNLRNALPTRFTPGAKHGRRKLPDTYDHSPLSRFSGTPVEPNLDHFHPFGSPVYVLDDALQSGHSHNKWSDRSKVGIFLCHSPHHASNVSLVLNTQTGNVTPQFHCIHDDAFDTCRRDAKFSSLWQHKAQLRPSSPSLFPTTSLPTTPTPLSVPSPAPPPPSSFRFPWTIHVPSAPDSPSRLTGSAEGDVPSIPDLPDPPDPPTHIPEPASDTNTNLDPTSTTRDSSPEPSIRVTRSG